MNPSESTQKFEEFSAAYKKAIEASDAASAENRRCRDGMQNQLSVMLADERLLQHHPFQVSEDCSCLEMLWSNKPEAILAAGRLTALANNPGCSFYMACLAPYCHLTWYSGGDAKRLAVINIGQVNTSQEERLQLIADLVARYKLKIDVKAVVAIKQKNQLFLDRILKLVATTTSEPTT